MWKGGFGTRSGHGTPKISARFAHLTLIPLTYKKVIYTPGRGNIYIGKPIAIFSTELWSSHKNKAISELLSTAVWLCTMENSWMLPCRCHTSILHLVSSLHRLFIKHSHRVILQALSSPLHCWLICSQLLVYTSFGYNTMYGGRHWKRYPEADALCANFICDATLCAGLLKTAMLSRDTEYVYYTRIMSNFNP